MSAPDFETIKKGIEESVKEVDFSCPQCKAPKASSRMVMQSLSFKDNDLVDIYVRDCFNCGNRFEVVSKPLSHMKDVAKTLDEAKRKSDTQ